MARFSTLFNTLLGVWIAFLCTLSLTAPLEVNDTLHLVKRDDSLYTIWKNIPGSQKAGGNSALYFPIDKTVDNSWGITYLYGCTALLISDPDYVIVAHLMQSAGRNIICINDEITLENYLYDTLQPALDQSRGEPFENTEVEVIYNTRDCPTSKAEGIQTIQNWLTDKSSWGIDTENIKYRPYSGGSGTGEPNPGRPDGLAAIRWLKPPPNDDLTIGTLQTFFNMDTPRRDQVFVKTKANVGGT